MFLFGCFEVDYSAAEVVVHDTAGDADAEDLGFVDGVRALPLEVVGMAHPRVLVDLVLSSR